MAEREGCTGLGVGVAGGLLEQKEGAVYQRECEGYCRVL